MEDKAGVKDLTKLDLNQVDNSEQKQGSESARAMDNAAAAYNMPGVDEA